MYVGGHSYRHLVVFRNNTGLSEATARPGPVVAGTAVDVAAANILMWHILIHLFLVYFSILLLAVQLHRFTLVCPSFTNSSSKLKSGEGPVMLRDLGTKKSGVSSKNEQMNSSQCS